MTITTTAFDLVHPFGWWIPALLIAVFVMMFFFAVSFDEMWGIPLFIFGLAAFITTIFYFSGNGTDSDLLKRDIASVGITDVEFEEGSAYEKFVGNRDGAFVKCALFETPEPKTYDVSCND